MGEEQINQEESSQIKYGLLTVVGEGDPYIYPNGKQVKRALCLCECGKYLSVRLCDLKSGKTTSCGDRLHRLDLSIINQKYGKLTVLSYDHSDKRYKTYWKCICDCGNEHIVEKSRLLDGSVQSCGCLRNEINRNRMFKHGLTKTRIHRIWANMLQRCTNPKCNRYKNYGARGIQVCEEWKDFMSFYNWAIDNGYTDTLTIERKDVNGNYEPNNCEWITSQKQSLNTTRSVKFTYNGITKNLSEWAKLFNTKWNILNYKIKHSNYSDFEKYFASNQTKEEK